MKLYSSYFAFTYRFPNGKRAGETRAGEVSS
jgi:hypothetical protein